MKKNKISGIISKLFFNVDNTKNLYMLFDHYGVCYSTKKHANQGHDTTYQVC